MAKHKTIPAGIRSQCFPDRRERTRVSPEIKAGRVLAAQRVQVAALQRQRQHACHLPGPNCHGEVRLACWFGDGAAEIEELRLEKWRGVGTEAPPFVPDVAAVTRTTQKIWPGVQTVPIMVMGATDGRYLRAAGIPTYGVQGFFFDRNDIRFHGRDERMSVQSFYEGQLFLYDLVKTLCESAK